MLDHGLVFQKGGIIRTYTVVPTQV